MKQREIKINLPEGAGVRYFIQNIERVPEDKKNKLLEIWDKKLHPDKFKRSAKKYFELEYRDGEENEIMFWIRHFYQWEQRLQNILHFVYDLEEKYYRLVWYARSDSPQENVKKLREQVEFEYPEETEDLKGIEGMWHHGFNSGMLAAARCIADVSLEGFPHLDT